MKKVLSYLLSISYLTAFVFMFAVAPLAHASAESIFTISSPGTGVAGAAQNYEFRFIPDTSVPANGYFIVYLPEGTTFQSGLNASDVTVTVNGNSQTIQDGPSSASAMGIQFSSPEQSPSIQVSVKTSGQSLEWGDTIVVKIGTNAGGDKQIVNTTVGGYNTFHLKSYTSGSVLLDSTESAPDSMIMTGVLDQDITLSAGEVNQDTDFTINLTAAVAMASGTKILFGFQQSGFTRQTGFDYTDVDFSVGGSARTLSSDGAGGTDKISFMVNNGYEYMVITLGSSVTAQSGLQVIMGTLAGGDKQYTLSSTAGGYLVNTTFSSADMQTEYANENTYINITEAVGAEAPEFSTLMLIFTAIAGFWMLNKNTKAKARMTA